jgi:hypothetical protein
MKLKYKETGVEVESSRFNTHTIGEVLTGDDSVPVAELDVYLETLGVWKDMEAAFEDHDLITDNLNTRFFEPTMAEDRERGYTYG